MILICEKQFSELMIWAICEHCVLYSEMGQVSEQVESPSLEILRQFLEHSDLIRLILSRRVDWVTSRGPSNLCYSVT